MASRRLLCSSRTPKVNAVRYLSSSQSPSSGFAPTPNNPISEGPFKGMIFSHPFPPIQRTPCTSWKKIRDDAAADGIDVDDPDLGFGKGCDFEHWRVWTLPLKGYPRPSKDHIIPYYIQILSHLLGSDKEAMKKIYSVATRHYFAFGANISDELAENLLAIPNVLHVSPDHYVDPEEKRYSWDPFINGQVLPYDVRYYPPGLHECSV